MCTARKRGYSRQSSVFSVNGGVRSWTHQIAGVSDGNGVGSVGCFSDLAIGFVMSSLSALLIHDFSLSERTSGFKRHESLHVVDQVGEADFVGSAGDGGTNSPMRCFRSPTMCPTFSRTLDLAASALRTQKSSPPLPKQTTSIRSRQKNNFPIVKKCVSALTATKQKPGYTVLRDMHFEGE